MPASAVGPGPGGRSPRERPAWHPNSSLSTRVDATWDVERSDGLCNTPQCNGTYPRRARESCVRAMSFYRGQLRGRPPPQPIGSQGARRSSADSTRTAQAGQHVRQRRQLHPRVHAAHGKWKGTGVVGTVLRSDITAVFCRSFASLKPKTETGVSVIRTVFHTSTALESTASALTLRRPAARENALDAQPPMH